MIHPSTQLPGTCHHSEFPTMHTYRKTRSCTPPYTSPTRTKHPTVSQEGTEQPANEQLTNSQLAAPLDPMTLLLTSITSLNMVIAHLVTQASSVSKVIQKLAPFKDEQGSEACHFFAAFMMWAMSQASALHHTDAQGQAIVAKDAKWIQAALSYLQDDAALWATPAMEELMAGHAPFNGPWTTFCDQFKAHFKTVDEAVNAKEKIRNLWQGSSTVPRYTAKFKELMGHTSYSSQDLHDQFWPHASRMNWFTLPDPSSPSTTSSLSPQDSMCASGNVKQRRTGSEERPELLSSKSHPSMCSHPWPC